MEDTIQTWGGYGLFSISLVVFWRVFADRTKDRDYWREKAMTLLGLHEDTLRKQEKLIAPLKKTRKR